MVAGREVNAVGVLTVLPEPAWLARQSAHETRARVWTDPHQARASRGEKHPVHDFLFSYYAFRPAFYGCFGLHEWAMVYRQTPDEVRHNAYPLRCPPDALAAIVEAAPITCTHFDAFRFFTAPARPLNKLQPTRETTPQHEQRGCLHAGMDLYKWAFKLAPFTPGELVADCFELACAIREVDMRASPYDLAALGYPPIAVETAAGRAEQRHNDEVAQEHKPSDRAICHAGCARVCA